MNKLYQILIFTIITFWSLSPILYAGLVYFGVIDTHFDWLIFWVLSGISSFVVYKFLTFGEDNPK